MIQARLHQLIEDAHAIMQAGDDLDLVSLDRTFTIRANDSVTSLLAAPLIGRVQAAAPGARLRFIPEGQEDLAPLRDGVVDLDVGVIADFGPEVHTDPLYDEHLVGVVASEHPLANKKVTLRRLASAPHVAVSRRGRRRGAIDTLLEAHGLRRTVVAVVPTFTSAIHIVLTSDMVGVFPRRYARQVAAFSGAHLFPIDAQLPALPISQAWHVRHNADPAHQWLRGQLHEVASQP